MSGGAGRRTLRGASLADQGGQTSIGHVDVIGDVGRFDSVPLFRPLNPEIGSTAQGTGAQHLCGRDALLCCGLETAVKSVRKDAVILTDLKASGRRGVAGGDVWSGAVIVNTASRSGLYSLCRFHTAAALVSRTTNGFENLYLIVSVEDKLGRFGGFCLSCGLQVRRAEPAFLKVLIQFGSSLHNI